MIYLDYAATTPMSKESIDIYAQVATSFYGNPTSLHDIGSSAEELLEKSRAELAEVLSCDPEGVYFTSGGSDANITALASMISAHQHKGNHLITSALEHSSILNFFKKMEGEGFEITYLPINSEGLIDPEVVKRAITEQTILASIQHVNGEIGVIQEVDRIGEILAQRDVLFHCDAVQSLGKVPIDIKTAQIDSLSISSHKVYGPKGVGAAYMNPLMKWNAQIPGTTHEGGFRSGTVDVPGIVAFVTSTNSVCNDMMNERVRMKKLRATLLDQMENFEQPFEIEGSETHGIPDVLGLRITHMEGQYIMLECNRYGIAISTGSACQVGSQAPSKVMLALGRTDVEAKQLIRLSFGRYTTIEDVQKTAVILRKIIEK